LRDSCIQGDAALVEQSDSTGLLFIQLHGKPLVLYNIMKLASCNSIEGDLLPESFAHAASVISESYPSMRVDE
jgi:hypothetical protein